MFCPVTPHHPRLRAQACPRAFGAGLQYQQAFQLLQIIGILVRGVLGVAAQQVSDQPLEAPFGDGAGCFDLRVVAAENGAVDPVEQQVALRLAQGADWRGRIEIKTVVVSGGEQSLNVT